MKDEYLRFVKHPEFSRFDQKIAEIFNNSHPFKVSLATLYMCSMCLEVSGSEATTSAFVRQQGGKAASRGEGLQSRSDI